MFEHLDDPRPPVPGDVAQSAVMARGARLRARRRAVFVGGGVAVTGVVVLALLAGSTPAPTAIDVTDDPTPTATESYDPVPRLSPDATPSPSPSPSSTSVPEKTVEPSAAPSTSSRPVSYPWDGAALTPPRPPFPTIAPCSAEQQAALHPSASAPPAGVEVTVAFGTNGDSVTRGLSWYPVIKVRNTGTAPFTYEDRGATGGVLRNGKLAGGGAYSASPRPVPTPVSRTLQPGESASTELEITTLDCRDGWRPLPNGRYEMSVAAKTDQGAWYAPPLEAWIVNRTSPGSDCFKFDPAPGRVAPSPGLTLTVEGAPSSVDRRDSSFTVRMVVTNTSGTPREILDLEPGRRVAYLISVPQYNPNSVQGGWTEGRAATAKRFVLAPGERKVFDVPVRGEACHTGEPMVSAVDLVVGFATVRDGKPYLWTSTRTRVEYPF